MLHYFETFRDIFKDESYPKSEEDWAKIYEEHGDLFNEAYDEFRNFLSAYECHKERRGESNRDAKYPWGYLGKFEAVELILARLAYRSYHIHRINHHDWKEIHSDVKYALEFWNKKLSDRRKWKREARKRAKVS